jgi:predicted nucleic acid-binding protein
MILADTSVWIEYLRRNPDYIGPFGELVEQRRILGLECVFAELLQGVKNDREARVIQEYWHNIPQIPESGIWMAAGYLCFREKLFAKGIGVIDAAIWVAAKKSKVKLWTLDKKLARVVPQALLFSPKGVRLHLV